MVGRLKDVFRVGGENVAPAEVEEVLLAHPAVETAQVVGVPDARLGEVPCAYVTFKAASRRRKRSSSIGRRRDAPTSACRAT
jgi:fatty-acyl-CoA synthase